MVQSGADVAQIAVASDQPAATGGAVPDGTYQLTGWTLYTGAGGASGPTGTQQAMTVVVQGQTAELVLHAATGTQRLTVTFTNSMNQTIIVQRCPDFGRPPVDEFTSSGDTLVLYDTYGGGALELTRVP